MPRYDSNVYAMNSLRGILPVATGWDTDPTNLDRCTDGKMTPITGTGSTVQGGAGTYGAITFDFGANKTNTNHWFFLSGLIGIWSTAGYVNLKMLCSDNGTDWTGGSPQIVPVSTATAIDFVLLGAVGAGRYASLQFQNDAAATCYARIAEVTAWDLEF